VGGLPLPPRSIKILRARELGNLGRPPAEESATEDPSMKSPVIGDGPFALRLGRLAREARTFAACNIALFLLTVVLAYRDRSTPRELLVPAALLTASTLGAILLYFTSRNWLWSFLDGQYAGMGYLVFVGAVMLMLADVIWNRARVMDFVLRFFLQTHR
jgi:hypothetical protein